jgi:hypothetical protein
MEDLHRVFIHELGHFVAHELDKRYFGGPGTKSIELFHHPKNPDIWGGEAKVNVSKDEKEKGLPSRNRIAEYLATSTYGCVFECYLLEISLSQCFKIGGHGCDDAQQWTGVLRYYNIFNYRGQIVETDNSYLKTLTESNSLHSFLDLNPNEFLEPNGTGYLVNVQKLRESTSDLVEKHAGHYKSLVKEYKVIIENAFRQLES